MYFSHIEVYPEALVLPLQMLDHFGNLTVDRNDIYIIHLQKLNSIYRGRLCGKDGLI